MVASSTMKFASLFSGCGGFDLGFISSGYRSIGAYDSDITAVNNFNANIPGISYNVDLTKGIPNEESLKGVDVLISGPPCQGFSTAGKRKIDDQRNHLLTLTGTLARRICPKVLVVENVNGASSGEHAKYLNALNGMMREAGYYTNTIKVQALDLGMAQQRRRILFFAWRTRREIHFSMKKISPKTLEDALRNVSNESNHNPQSILQGSRDWLIASRIKSGQKLSNVRGGENSVATWDIPEVFGKISEKERTVLEMLRRLRRQERLRDYGDADPVSYVRLEAALGHSFRLLIESLISKGYLRRIDGGIDLVGTFNGKFRRLSWDRPSCTVDTRFGSYRYFLHPERQRGFTVREAARIQGFPDAYIFLGKAQSQFRVIGNAVPPPLGSLAANISKRLIGCCL